jgi:hypothetical protein
MANKTYKRLEKETTEIPLHIQNFNTDDSYLLRRVWQQFTNMRQESHIRAHRSEATSMCDKSGEGSWPSNILILKVLDSLPPLRWQKRSVLLTQQILTGNSDRLSRGKQEEANRAYMWHLIALYWPLIVFEGEASVTYLPITSLPHGGGTAAFLMLELKVVAFSPKDFIRN